MALRPKKLKDFTDGGNIDAIPANANWPKSGFENELLNGGDESLPLEYRGEIETVSSRHKAGDDLLKKFGNKKDRKV